MNPVIAKVAKSAIKKALQAKLVSMIPTVVDAVVRSYDANLNGIVKDRKSKTRPESYQPLFEARLGAFDFIQETEGGFKFKVPEMGTFKFNNGLEVIETICEGLPGKYVTITGEQYKEALGRYPRVLQETNNDAQPKDRVYLLRAADPLVKKIEKAINEELRQYEFSNFPPVDIFKEANDLVDDEMTVWVDEAMTDAMKKMVSTN
jgi:hypothetical protein